MNLFELTRLGIRSGVEPVPAWTLGCFRRRSITFFNGRSDDRTEVLWLQSHGLTADLRLQPNRPRRAPTADELGALATDELVALASVEGGLASTRWDGEAMHWSDWVSFQTHAKWPEPGLLRRAGSSLIEFAPSGAYVEDWRLQPSAPGPLIGLRLLEERDRESGRVLHRGGGLVVCGDHAALVRGRPNEPRWNGRVSDFVRDHAAEPSALAAVFAFDAAYAPRDAAGNYVVRAATNPEREGTPLMSLEGFSYDAERGIVVQRGDALERRFTVDTLEPLFEPDLTTPATDAARAWLDGERDTLLAFAR